MKNFIYLLPILLIIGCSDISEKGKWSEADMVLCVSQMDESAGKFDWDEVGVDFDTKKWASCVCKKSEKEWTSFQMMDRKEKDKGLKKLKEKKMREIFESCRVVNFDKRNNSEKQTKKLARETTISAEQTEEYINILEKAINEETSDKYVKSSDLTNQDGVSLDYLDKGPNYIYKDQKLYSGYMFKEFDSQYWTCISGWPCIDNRMSHYTFMLTKIVKGKKEGLNVIVAEFRGELKLVQVNYRKNGLKHGTEIFFDPYGKITTNVFWFNGKLKDCSGSMCQEIRRRL